jgi:hypothetical protein
MIPLSTMTPAERDSLAERLENALPVRYFIVDYELEDGPDLVEVQKRDFLMYEGEITYERHSIRENGVNQICLIKGLTP